MDDQDNTTMRLLNLVCIIIGLGTGLLWILVAHNAALSGVAIAIHGILGVVGGYVGTWLLLIAAVILLSIASGVALGLFILFSLLCFLAAIFALFS